MSSLNNDAHYIAEVKRAIKSNDTVPAICAMELMSQQAKIRVASKLIQESNCLTADRSGKSFLLKILEENNQVQRMTKAVDYTPVTKAPVLPTEIKHDSGDLCNQPPTKISQKEAIEIEKNKTEVGPKTDWSSSPSYQAALKSLRELYKQREIPLQSVPISIKAPDGKENMKCFVRTISLENKTKPIKFTWTDPYGNIRKSTGTYMSVDRYTWVDEQGNVKLSVDEVITDDINVSEQFVKEKGHLISQ